MKESLRDKIARLAKQNPSKKLPKTFNYSAFVESKPQRGESNGEFPSDDQFDSELEEQDAGVEQPDNQQTQQPAPAPDPNAPAAAPTQQPAASDDGLGTLDTGGDMTPPADMGDLGFGGDDMGVGDDSTPQTAADASTDDQGEEKDVQVASEKIGRKLEKELDSQLDDIVDKVQEKMSAIMKDINMQLKMSEKNDELLSAKIEMLTRKLSKDDNSQEEMRKRAGYPFTQEVMDKPQSPDVPTKRNRDVNANYDMKSANNRSLTQIRDTLLDY